MTTWPSQDEIDAATAGHSVRAAQCRARIEAVMSAFATQLMLVELPRHGRMSSRETLTRSLAMTRLGLRDAIGA